MAELLQKQKSPFNPLHRGDIIKGKITKLTTTEILMDIHYKTEAIVIEKERRLLKNLISLLKVGDEVSAVVISPESEKGYPVVSLRHYVDDLAWKKLQDIQNKQERIAVRVQEATRGGFIIETTDGIIGFLPNSHVSFKQNQEELVGQEIKVGILELNRESKKIIFSQKSVVSLEDFHKATKGWKAGNKITGIVSGITPFGLFVSIPKKVDKAASDYDTQDFVDGLIHISEISWERAPMDLQTIFQGGQEIEAVITGFDDNAKRVDLSIKRLTIDPFENIAKHFTLDQKVSGTISQVSDAGISVTLSVEGNQIAEGFIRKEKVPPTMKFEEGKKINAIVSQVDSKKRKIMLVPALVEKPLGYR